MKKQMWLQRSYDLLIHCRWSAWAMPFLPQRMRRPCLLVRCRSTPWASQARILGVLLARPLLLADTTTHGTSQCSQPGHARVAGATRTGASHGAHEPSAFSRPSRRPVAVSTTHSTKPACGDRAFSVNPAFSTPPILKICVSYQDKGSLLSSVLVSTRKAAHVQSSPAVPCRLPNPGSLRGDTGAYPYCHV